MEINNITIIARVDGVAALFPVYNTDLFLSALSLLQSTGPLDTRVKAIKIPEEFIETIDAALLFSEQKRVEK